MENKKKHAFLLIGQSNMAGRGDRGEVEPIRNSSCVMLRMGLWRPMTEPITPDQSIWEGFGKYELRSGVSLAASFADAWQKYSGCEVGLIPCAFGGSKLSQWMPGENLFENAVFQTKLALRDSELRGILWHQGESDSHLPEEAESYFDRFKLMSDTLRARLGAESVPLIVGELGSFVGDFENGKYPYWPVVNCALHRAAEELRPCAVVSAQGLSCRPDHLHFDSRSLREFGLRYFEALAALDVR